jgi:hypothetical protein
MLFFLWLCVYVSCEIHHYRIIGENNQLSQKLVEMSSDVSRLIFGYPSCVIHIYGTWIPRDQPNHDPLYKISLIIDYLNLKFWNVYTLVENLTINETICTCRVCIVFQIIWKGSHHSRLPVVPVIWKESGRISGMKLFQIYGAKYGYLWNLEVYCGAHSANI